MEWAKDILNFVKRIYGSEGYAHYPTLLRAIHMITELLLFWNEFILSPYISLYLLTWYQNDISFPYKSFGNEFVSVFYSERNSRAGMKLHSFLYHVNWEQTSFRIENRKSCSPGRVMHANLIWRENHPSETRTPQPAPFDKQKGAKETTRATATRTANSNRFRWANNDFARASRFVVHFFAVTARLRPEKV